MGHLPHHLGVDRTLYLAKQIRSEVSRDMVKRVLQGCEPCGRIDPARRAENHVPPGELVVRETWSRVAADVTHVDGSVFLTMVDCGPSRFSIWRRMRNETAGSIVAQLRQVVIERGPPVELLLDNSTAFRSALMEEFAGDWGISLRFRAAYAPSGNGIVERNHRTIKRIAARGKITPEEATFWYNVTPRKDQDVHSVPSSVVHTYPWRLPFDIGVDVEPAGGGPDGHLNVGDDVWLKPNVPSCTKEWAPGTVTRVVSQHVVEVDGMPRHVRDIRLRRAVPRVATPSGRQYVVDEVVEPPGVDTAYDGHYVDVPFGPPLGGGDVHRALPEEGEQPQVVADAPPVEPPAEDQQVVQVDNNGPVLRRSQRDRRPPEWLADFVTGNELDDMNL